jgi:Fuc2NAc and GlcNAc transferase
MHTLTLLGLLAVAASSISLLGTHLVRRVARARHLLDRPNGRSAHVRPTPRLGGIGIMCAFLPVATVTVVCSGGGAGALSTVITTGIIAALGLVDDLRPLPARWRFGVQLAAATVVVGANVARIESAWTLLPLPVWLLAPASVLWIVWVTNLYNFMDGIDGLAGAEASSVGIIAGALFLMAGRGDLAVVALLMAAAALGFLGWNWPPARIFMGDVGSGFLGFTFGALSLIASRSGTLPLALCLMLAGVFAFDATLTLLRRMARGEPWHQPHRSHAYQRLVQAGSTHAEVSGGVVLVNLGLGVFAWLAQSGRLPVAIAVLAGIVVLTVLYLAIERRRPMFSDASDPMLP